MLESVIQKIYLDVNSFQNLNKWVEYVREERGNDVLVVLVGNKIDAAENRFIISCRFSPTF